jgi:hypothetical protein
MKELRHEIYDEQGNIIKIEIIQVDEPSQEELLAEKQAELLRIYKEIQDLQNDTKS